MADCFTPLRCVQKCLFYLRFYFYGYDDVSNLHTNDVSISELPKYSYTHTNIFKAIFIKKIIFYTLKILKIDTHKIKH